MSAPLPPMGPLLLPKAYTDLAAEPGPKMLLEALALFGVKETAGPKDTPIIVNWGSEIHVDWYTHDSVPWCGLFMAVAAQRAGWDLPAGPLYALNWRTWGAARSGDAMLGDVLVKKRTGGGHVTMYVGEDATSYHCLGGNQDDQVCIRRMAKSGFVAVRHAPWRVAQPANVRRIYRSAAGAPVSKKED